MLLQLALLFQVSLPQPTIRWERQDLTASTGEPVPSETGFLVVPEHHGKPGGGEVRLFVARLRATTDRPGVPIVYLAGGPGNAGVPTRPDFSPLVLGLRASGDFIFYDQRGTGRSTPSLVIPGRLDLPADQSVWSGGEARLLAMTKAALDTLRARGVDPTAYTTAESVEDLDALRRALGAEQLVLWGHSYGSHLALAYLKRHPDRVVRLMIGGINGPDHRWRLPSDGDLLLARIDSALRADPRGKAAFPDFMGLVRRVMQRLAREPLMVEQDGKRWWLGADEVASAIAIQSGEIEFIKRLPQLFTWLDAGDGTVMNRIVRGAVRERPIGTAMTYTMHLASGVSPERLARIRRESSKAIFGNAINWPWDLASFAKAWGVPDLGEEFRRSVRSEVPAFLYSGTFDGRTSLADAEEIRKGLPHSVHVIVDGAAHAPHLQSVELLPLMLDFVAGRPVKSQHLKVPLEFRGPNEPAQIGELRRIATEQGGAAAAASLRSLADQPTALLTSYVPGTTSGQLLNDAKLPKAAAELLETAVQLFPASAVLQERLGDAYLAQADTTRARAAYQRAGQLDPFTLSPRIALVRLNKGS